jgi:hypothetical protein
LIHILSEEELNPELQGQIRLIDAETNEAKDIFFTSQLLNKYKDHLKDFSSNIKEFSKKLGATYTFVCSNDEIQKVVFENLIKLDVIR